MQDFMDEYTGGQYFNNVIGIIEYFQEDSVFNDSEWAKRSDAAVLLAIQDGQRALQGATSMGDYTEFMRRHRQRQSSPLVESISRKRKRSQA